ncbi:MAG TPA: hypothetical protein DCF63_16410 [Planctomycetaceae bacterium]|nr:hypothetical protein [Planctomycetaceae bacterium]
MFFQAQVDRNRVEQVQSIEESLLNQLRSKFGTDAQLNDSLVMLGIDSVGMAELTYDLEQMYKIKVDDGLLNVDTVQDLVDYVRQRQSQ